MRKRYWVMAAVAALAEVLLLGFGALVMAPAENGSSDYNEVGFQIESGDEQVWRNGYW